ncbi:hypothetical protein GCM10022287_19610 [Gryllotalpicola koreensis]|uniref:Uncharacterized protein n=2 Tax=Gryllotalpicola koreensis TaxID=993086 RepID=A0ABP8A0I0_9MICO
MDKLRRGRMKDPVEGEFTVASADHYVTAHMDYVMAFRVDGVVTAPGVPPTPVRRDPVTVRREDWIQVGQVFPATVDRADPKRAVIAFPVVENAGHSSSESRRAAEGLARQMASEQEKPSS